MYRDDTADRMWFLFRQKQNKNEKQAEENKEEDKVQIGLTVDSFVIERWIRDRDVFVATARELGGRGK